MSIISGEGAIILRGRLLFGEDQASRTNLPWLIPDGVHLPTGRDPLWADPVPPSHIHDRTRGAAWHAERGDSWPAGGQGDCWLGQGSSHYVSMQVGFDRKCMYGLYFTLGTVAG